MAGYSPGARDAGVPAPRRPRPARPRRPRPPGRRAAPRAAAAAQPRRHPAGGPRAARPRGARGAQAAGPRRRPWTTPTAPSARCSWRTCRPSTAAAVSELAVVRLAEPRGPRGLRADQGPARPRAARPAVRRHEAGARERHRRGPRGDQRDAQRPQRAARQAPPRRGHRRRTSTSSWPSTATSSRRTRRTSTSCSTRWPSARPPPSGCCNSMTAEQRDELTRSPQQAFGSPGADGVAGPARRQPAGAAPRRGLGRLGAVRRRARGSGSATAPACFQDLADLDELAEQLSQSYGGARMDDLDLDTLARQLGDEAAVDARTLQRARAGAARQRLPQARLRRPAPADPEGDAPARQGAAARRRRADVRPAGPARPAPGRRGGRAVRRHPGVGVRRHRAVGRHPHDDQRRAPHRRRGRLDPARRRPARHRATSRCTETEARTQAARGAARRHVVLDGDGRPLGADEAHRARPAHADLAPGSAATTCS